jgi:O-antigen ligase
LLKLERILGLVVCAFAISLSFRITYTWIVLVVGIILWAIWKLTLLVRRENKQDRQDRQDKQDTLDRQRERRFESTTRKLSMIEFGPLTAPLLAYALAVAISGLIRPVYEYGHLTAKEILASVETLRAFIVYFWAFDIFKHCPRLRVPAVFCILVTSAVSGIVAAVQQLRNWHPWSGAYLQGTGFFSEPMAFSGVMQIFSLLALGLFLSDGFLRFPKPFNRKPIFLIVALANIAGLVFASERGAWVGFACAALCMTALLSFRTFAISVATLVAAMTAGWFFVPVIKQRLLPMLSGQNDFGISSRMMIWKRAYDEFLKAPITGIGTTRFPHVDAQGATDLGKNYLAHAHNNALQLLSTAGIIGFCTYLWITISAIAVSLFHFFRNTSSGRGWANFKQRNERGLALGLFGALVSLSTAGLTEYNFGTGQVRLALWFALALLSTDV